MHETATLHDIKEPRDCNLLKFRDMCAPRPTQRNTRPCISAKPSALTTSYSVRAKEGFQYWYHERPKPTSCNLRSQRVNYLQQSGRPPFDLYGLSQTKYC
ncbi:hypothetical protein LSAT2_000456 [Lamellibrachia satsuma]|nr:hypothetical protein LSAT2_000456 [Lamellibrachia satsuma]